MTAEKREKKAEDGQQERPGPAKKPYTRPELFRHGVVEEFTGSEPS